MHEKERAMNAERPRAVPRRPVFLLLFHLLLLLALPAWLRAEAPFGYWEFRSLRLHGSGDDEGSAMRLRPSWKGDWGDARWRITGEWHRSDGLVSGTGQGESEGRIERASLEWTLGRETLRVGRQAINWGHGMLFNPTDPFRELFLTNVWYERAGVDGLRWIHGMGSTGGIVAAFATPDRWADRRFALRLFDSRPGFDRALVFLRDPETGRDKVGFDLKGDLGVGWWFEGLHDEGLTSSHDEWVFGLDYTFPWRQGFYLAVQRYSDGSGEDRAESYDWMSLLAGGRRSLGRSYLVLNGRLTWDATLSFQLDLIRNESDGSRILSPHVNWQWTDDRQLHLGVNFYRGAPGSEYNPGPILDPGGQVPDRVVYLWLRQHF